MAEYIFLMHDDAIADEKAWEPYLGKLKQSGFFQGGNAIGGGVCVRKSGVPASVTAHLVQEPVDPGRSRVTWATCVRPLRPPRSARDR